MLFSTCLVTLLVPLALAIWPAPQTLTTGHSVLWIDSSIKVIYNGVTVAFNFKEAPERHTGQSFIAQLSSSHKVRDDSFSSDGIIHGAVARAFDILFKQTPIPWKLVPRNELGNYEPQDNQNKVYVSTLIINQKAKDATFKPLAGEVDESYNLTLSEKGEACIEANASAGVLHALQTFVQLFFQHSNGQTYSNISPVTINDFPKFQHRALNLDVARNWFPIEHILRTIEAMSWNKFNRLHIHMTDAQSWPMDIPALPLLSQKGAFQKGLSYSPAEIELIQRFGIEHGIEVIIEFDMPGHTTAVGHAYPELIAAFDARPYEKYCAEPPCGSLQLGNPAVYGLLEKLWDDVLPRVSPYSSYFHTGGDEVNPNTYLLDPTVNSNKLDVLRPLVQKLVNFNHDRVRQAGLTPIVWEEMLIDWELDLGEDVIVQSWLSDDSVAKITSRGHKALAGNYNYWYLDCGKGGWRDYENGAAFDKYFPFTDYCAPYKNWRLVYAYDPLAGVDPAKHHLVIGGVVHMWSEQTDPVNLDDMIWPRAAAAAEVLWSGRQDANGQNRTQLNASPRLSEMRERMVTRGIRAGPVQMIFCTQGNATACALEPGWGV